MGRFVFFIILVVCMAGTFRIYREELREFLPERRIGEYKKGFEKELNKWVMRKNNTLLDRELFSSSVILKNLSLVRRETPLSADYIYESLMNNSQFLKPFYGEMLTLYRSGRDEEAFKILTVEIGTKAARNFAIILSKIDKINPAELIEQMEVFQQMMTEKNTTVALKRTQRNSVITITASVCVVFVQIINFAVVVVFMDTISTLNNLFL